MACCGFNEDRLRPMSGGGLSPVVGMGCAALAAGHVWIKNVAILRILVMPPPSPSRAVRPPLSRGRMSIRVVMSP